MFYQSKHVATSDYLHIHHGNNLSFPQHMHECFEIINIISGEMHVTVDNHKYCLHANDALLIFPYQIHGFSSESCEHFICVFSPKLIYAFYSQHTNAVPVCNLFSPPAHLLQTFHHVTPQASIVEKMAVLYSLCAIFEKNASYCLRENIQNDLLLKIFRFVENEFPNDCSLKALSNAVGYEYTYLSRFFKNTVGSSFISYVNHYRLSQACYMMETSDRSILQCALDCGYANIRSFNRNFISFYGMTPTEYKKSVCQVKQSCKNEQRHCDK